MKNHKHTKATSKTPFALRMLRFIYNTAGRLFPVYFGNLAFQQWFTTFRHKIPAAEKLVLDTARQESVVVNNINVAVYIWQSNSPKTDKTLLFIHGWTGRGTQIAYYVKKLNALGYRVISFDGIAHGQTEGVQTSAYEMTDAALALNEKYGKFDATITHSFGGMVLAYAMSLGYKTDYVAMICPPASFEIIQDNFQRILCLPESVMKIVIRKTFANYGQCGRDKINTLNNVKNLKCKALILHDEDDMDVPWHSGEEIAKIWQGAKFIKTRGLGHRRIIRDEAVVNHIVSFLDTSK